MATTTSSQIRTIHGFQPALDNSSTSLSLIPNEKLSSDSSSESSETVSMSVDNNVTSDAQTKLEANHHLVSPFVREANGHLKRNLSSSTVDGPMNQGYASDDEASDSDDEPTDSGRTRSSSRRAIQANKGDDQSSSQMQMDTSNGSKGTKRKRKGTTGSEGDDSDGGNDKSRSKTDPVVEQAKICSCQPTNVMKCIGILPSLPIVSHFYDSDSSDSSFNDDLTHTVLPSVERKRTQNGEC